MQIRQEYQGYIKKKKLTIFLLCVAIAFMVVVAINVGSSNMSLMDSFLSLIGQGSEKGQQIIYRIRLPRVLGAIVAGVGLSLSGLLLQSILNNPLASPATLGVNSAAAFGANVAIIIFGIGSAQSSLPIGIGFFAFAFSMASSLAILALARANEFSRHAILLAGVAIGSFFTAGTTALQYFAEDTQIATAVFWTFGDLGRINYNELAILSLITFFAVIYSFRKKWDLNAIGMGEQTARGLGVDAKKITRNMLILSSLLTATSVAYVGMIGFVGLIAPQITRRILGTDKRFMIPASLLFGGLILLLADTLARTLIAPVILPVGAVTSFFGAPLFLYILLREKKL